MKKIWRRPQLQILTRGKAEETVLANCKDSIGWDGGSTPYEDYRSCRAMVCPNCSASAGS